MKLSEIFQIIKEEVQDFFSDWQVDEPSVTDKYYEKYYGIDADDPNKEPKKVDANVIGYVTKDWGRRPLQVGIPVYKNPNNLDGIGKLARGILMNNGDLYVAKTYYAAHEIIIEVLVEKGIIPPEAEDDYQNRFPNEYIAVIRSGVKNVFVQSDAYKEFPSRYLDIFKYANTKHPYKFEAMEIVREEIDPNTMLSNIPKGYNPNILYEKNVNKY